MDPACKIILRLETKNAREAFERDARAALAAGEQLLRLVDTIGPERMILHAVAEGCAEVVAIEPPMILPGGRTSLVSYVRARCATIIEHVLENGRVESRAVTVSAVVMA